MGAVPSPGAFFRMQESRIALAGGYTKNSGNFPAKGAFAEKFPEFFFYAGERKNQ